MKFKILEKLIANELMDFLGTKDAKEVISKANGEDKDYTIRFKITNESIDRDGEIIKADGIDWGPFDKNPAFLIDHRYTVGSIAGKVVKRETKGTETYLTVVLAKGIPAGELVKRLHEQGMIKGVSIGFMPLERDAGNNSIITKSEALEASAVAIGSNREALMDEKNAKLFKEVSKNWEENKKNEKEIPKNEIDLKTILDNIKEIKDEITSIKTIISSKDKEVIPQKDLRKKTQGLVKHLSMYLGETKPQ